MIREIFDRPHIFDHIDIPCRWFQLWGSNCLYGYLALQADLPAVGVHLEVIYWAPSILKQMRADWLDVVAIAKDMGAKRLLAINKNFQDARWPKLISHFGFPAPTVLAVSHQEV